MTLLTRTQLKPQGQKSLRAPLLHVVTNLVSTKSRPEYRSILLLKAPSTFVLRQSMWYVSLVRTQIKQSTEISVDSAVVSSFHVFSEASYVVRNSGTYWYPFQKDRNMRKDQKGAAKKYTIPDSNSRPAVSQTHALPT